MFSHSFLFPYTIFRAHYNVMLRGVEVGGTALDISVGLFSDFRRGTIIDSGTTLAYLPEAVYLRLMKKVLTKC